MADRGAVDEPGREVSQAGALGRLADQIAREGLSPTELGERSRDDYTLGPGQFDPDEGKPDKDKDGRRCPPGKHWNKEKKKCVPNQGGQDEREDEEGRRCPRGFHWNKNKKKCVKNRPENDRGNTGGRGTRGPFGGGGGNTGGNNGGGNNGGGNTGGGDNGGGNNGGGNTGGGNAGGGGGDANAPLIQAAYSLYFQLWGQVPPQGYIEKLVRQGMNLWEIAYNERSKPAFKKTKTYNDRASELVGSVNNLLGYY